MEPCVSLVLPSYNIGSLLELNLCSLYRQDYPSTRYEVIVVDDSSTDGTQVMLETIDPPFDLKTVHTGGSAGRARSRNLGASHADGEIIIFCDGDTLQPPGFVRSHADLQSGHDHVVASSLPLHYALVYTHYFSRFSPLQKSILYRLDPSLKGSSRDGRIVSRERVMDDFESVRGLTWFPAWFKEFEELARVFGSFDAIPSSWMSFVTRNVSISKTLFEASKGFDEGFRRWGLEDWELGYRLKGLGARFACEKAVINYHQEHPVDDRSRGQSNRENFAYFCEKHDSPEVYLFGDVCFPAPGRALDLVAYNMIVDQYTRVREWPGLQGFCAWFHDSLRVEFRKRFGRWTTRGIPPGGGPVHAPPHVTGHLARLRSCCPELARKAGQWLDSQEIEGRSG
ncbi:MAG: glycosyltransferase family 2 protein [Ignavibacteriales bacterium]